MHCTTVYNDTSFKREFFACSVYKDRYVVVAAGDRGFYLQSAAMYDVHAQSHIALPNLPFFGSCSGVVIADYFYVAKHHGIYRICLSGTKPLQWEVVRDTLNHEIKNMMTDGNHLYFIRRDRIYQYDVTMDKLIYLSSLPSQIRFSTMVSGTLVDNKIYFIKPNLQDRYHIVFNITTGLWSVASPIPIPVVYASIYNIDRWIVVTGEKTQMKDNSSVRGCVFDTMTGRWMEYDGALSTPRRGHKFVKVGSQVLYIGGRDKCGTFAPVEAIHMKHFVNDWNWEIIKDLVILGELIDQKRASPISSTKMTTPNSTIAQDTSEVIQRIFTDLSLDIFRNIISFLI